MPLMQPPTRSGGHYRWTPFCSRRASVCARTNKEEIKRLALVKCTQGFCESIWTHWPQNRKWKSKGANPALIPMKSNTGEIHFSLLSFARAARSGIEFCARAPPHFSEATFCFPQEIRDGMPFFISGDPCITQHEHLLARSFSKIDCNNWGASRCDAQIIRLAKIY